MSLKIVIPVIVLVIIAIKTNAAPSTPTDCNKRMLTMDKHMRLALLVTNPDQVLYEDQKELNEKWCKPAKGEYMKKIGEYKPCLKAFPRQLFGMVLQNSKKNLNSVCTTVQQRNEMVKNLKCFTNETLPDMVQITHDLTSLIEYLSNMTNVDKIIPGMCCGYQMILPEIRGKLGKLCDQNGIGESGSGTNYFIGIIKSAIADALDMMCGAYETLDSCNKKVPEILEEFSLFRNGTTNMKYPYTAIVPFLRVIERIDTATNI